MTLAPGTVLGSYTVIGPLGAGGMGEVYRARDSRLGRDIAIKILPEPLSQNADALARFEREARTLATLSHPNILCIYELGQHGEERFLVTELLEGSTLRTIIRENQLQTERALRLAVGIAEGLAAAHAKGIVHRDLKPENIFVTPEDRVKILDFGLARSIQSPTTRQDGDTFTLISTPGAVLGTIAYMSPEQLRGQSLNASSDIFSFGAILYEVLTGRKAFGGDSPVETMAMILREEPAEMEIRPDLAALVRHCIEKRPERRFQSGEDLAFSLRSAAAFSDSTRVQSGRASPVSRKNLVIAPLAIGLVLAILAALSWSQRPQESAEPAMGRSIDSLAVLPFVNASSNSQLDYLSDGITETVINNLSPLDGLRVMSRGSSFPYKGKEMSPSAIAKDLNVDALIIGRVQQVGESLIVSAELIDGRDQHQIWGDRFTASSSDPFEIEGQIARRISEKLRIELSREDEQRFDRRPTVDPKAYGLYLQARYEWNKRTPEALRQAIRLFQEAIDRDPAYSLAYAGLADSYVLLGGIYELVPPRESMPVARAAAGKALALDPSLAEPHAALGVINHEYDWRWGDAETEFRKAIELNPNYATAHQWYGMFLVYRGRFDEGLREVRMAEDLDPLSMVIKADICQALFLAGRFDEAIHQSKTVIDLFPNFWFPYLWLGLSYEQKTMLPKAIESVELAVNLGGHSGALGTLAYLYARAGRRDEALKLLAQIERASAENYVSPFTFFLVHAALGDMDRGFQYLDRAFDERSSLMTVLQVMPTAPELRSEPRLRAIIGKMEEVGAKKRKPTADSTLLR